RTVGEGQFPLGDQQNADRRVKLQGPIQPRRPGSYYYHVVFLFHGYHPPVRREIPGLGFLSFRFRLRQPPYLSIFSMLALAAWRSDSSITITSPPRPVSASYTPCKVVFFMLTHVISSGSS